MNFVQDPVAYVKRVQQIIQTDQMTNSQLQATVDRITDQFLSQNGYFAKNDQFVDSDGSNVDASFSTKLVLDFLSPDSPLIQLLMKNHNQHFTQNNQQTFVEQQLFEIFDPRPTTLLLNLLTSLVSLSQYCPLSLQADNYFKPSYNLYLVLLNRWINADLTKLTGTYSFTLQVTRDGKRTSKVIFCESTKEWFLVKLLLQQMRPSLTTDLRGCICDQISQVDMNNLDTTKKEKTVKICPVDSPRSMCLLILQLVQPKILNKSLLEFCTNYLIELSSHIQKSSIQLNLLWAINKQLLCKQFRCDWNICLVLFRNAQKNLSTIKIGKDKQQRINCQIWMRLKAIRFIFRSDYYSHVKLCVIRIKQLLS
ncbi:Hypothetical_protein [Hexamita inflata]|uniref:Hypothetical_protein n=1 Tax=Hexamita inflata TaxID=28002 RepID=A0ABP1HJJ8_9EUKA